MRCVAGALALIAAIAAWSVFSVAPAAAFSQHGHAFSAAFGESGTVLGQFAAKVGPAGVAVSESSGDVYVVDPGNQRVDQFGPEGKAIAEWGWGVTDGKAESEVCTSGCQAGTAGTGAGQFDYPSKLKGLERGQIAIAVDNSTSGADPSKGDVYVVGNTVSEPNVVEKFGPEGKFINQVKLAGGTFVGGLAVDSTGSLWVEAGSALFHLEEPEHFNNAVENALISLVPFVNNEQGGIECATPGFAVDANSETLYVDHERLSVEGELCTPEEEEVIKEERAEFKKHERETEVTRKAVQRIVAARLHFSGTPPAVLETPAVDREETSDVAVDQSAGHPTSGNAYIDNETSVATFTKAGVFVQRFGEKGVPNEKIGQSTSLTVNGESTEGGIVYVSDFKKDRIEVFSPEGVGAPMIDSISAVDVEPTKTELKAQIDPHGQATTYVFETCLLPEASCTPVGEGTIPAGFGDVGVAATAGELQPATTYYYRVIAVNATAAAKSSQALHTFTTLPQAAGLLPDNRAWELVSPPNKQGATLEAIGGVGTNQAAPSVGLIEASEDGTRIGYSANTATESAPEGNRAPESQQIIAARGAHWASKDIQTPLARGTGIIAGQPEEYQAFSNDLSHALLRPPGLEGSFLEEPALVHEGEQRNLFLRKNFDPTCEAPGASCFEPLVTSENTKAPEFGAHFTVLGATSDLHHVVFRSADPVPLLPGATPNSIYEWNAGAPAAEQLKLVDVLPGGAVEEAPGGQQVGFGGELTPVSANEDSRHAVSEDGSRIFWTGGKGLKECPVGCVATELYMRDMTGGRTLDVSEPESGVSALDTEVDAGQSARFQTASTNGETVFFTDTAPLTRESMLHVRANHEQNEPPTDLYACRIKEKEGKLACSLKDLSIDARANIGEDAHVTTLILGASNDGAYVYFVAGGGLGAPNQGAKAGTCEGEETADTCNLYVDHFKAAEKEGEEGEWEEPKLIARLSEEDSGDWGSGLPLLFQLSSRVSPSGHFLAFMSNQELTGYDNEDQVTHVRDEEVYLYDATHEKLICASCNPNGHKPVGVLDEKHTREGNGLLVDRPQVWLGKTLAGSIPTWTYTNQHRTLYQSRYLNDEGRLFFNSPEELVTLPEGEKFVHAENVYEYEPAGAGGSLGTCSSPSGCVGLLSSGTSDRESAFLDASADGSNVFFLTAARLVAADVDESLDVYDARECSAESPCIQSEAAAPRPCESTQSCHPSFETPPTFEGSTLGGTGNLSKVINRGEEPSKQTGTSKKPTTAQLLAAALKKCHKIKNHKKRKSCERTARKRYAAKKASHHGARHR